ncbi:hypothetical protein K402DRAFT_417670 [Aulographum hederae CBS 113979]|uniref:GIT Spa2 homology (SHD) domain-containing protein n=1 Tax=Aulographum hederae CBS 113979 TaxID=1176131 RepID=A0A6G1HAW4_9PEZI|nr:hypothetical protein K402DRAFT_417670 [Aulographum hederae CBS 113979]
MNGRAGPLSPVSIDSTDWSPITKYQNLPGNEHQSPVGGAATLATPPASGHTSAATTADGLMSRRRPSNGNPSPPSSVARSSEGNGLYAGSVAGSNDGRRQYMLEEALSEHYIVVKRYLAPYLKDERDNSRQNRARDKLQRLSSIQFQELSTDVYDELQRREAEKRMVQESTVAKYLLPKNSFHYKRNQARQKLSTLPTDRFRQLATDVFYELERRFPKFTTGADRSASPAPSFASARPNSRASSRNGMGYRGPPPPGGRGGQMAYGGPGGPGGYGPGTGTGYGSRPGTSGGSMSGGSPQNEFGRPMPKTFQSNTIIPNKGTMVEDDDDESRNMDDDNESQDAFGLESAARQSRRTTNKSFAGAPSKLNDEYREQINQLENKIDDLETKLRTKDAELDRTRAQSRDGESMKKNFESEKSEWSRQQDKLESQLAEANRLNSSLQDSVDQLRTENSGMQRDLEEARSNPVQLPSRQDNDWRQRYEDLSQDFSAQEALTDSVRREALQYLQEMRMLSENTTQSFEKEEQLQNQVSSLERELREWKSRYARTKTQLRSLRASSIGLAPGGHLKMDQDVTVTRPDGAVKDVHVTKFQLSIDELLQSARRSEQNAIIEAMKGVVVSVKGITSDVEKSTSTRTSATSDAGSDIAPSVNRLRQKVSATANNLITASKNHASSLGLSPVSLLDAAASHLTTSVVDLLRSVGVRPTPADELAEDEDDIKSRSSDYRGSLSGRRSYISDLKASYSASNGINGRPSPNQRHMSKTSVSSFGGSIYSPSRSDYAAKQDQWSYNSKKENAATARVSRPVGLGLASAIGGLREDDQLDDFKHYLEDQTAVLVSSIQPLVDIIRGKKGSPDDIPNYTNNISTTIEDIFGKTKETIEQSGNDALAKHAPPVVNVLEDCRQVLVGDSVDKMPPVAFKIAKAMKELTIRVAQIQDGELTAQTDAPFQI